MKKTREVYKKNYTNAEIAAGNYEVFQDQTTAEKSDYLPHNQLIIANQNTSCTLFIFLDDFQDQTKPDYILFPSQQMVIEHTEGVTFTTLFIKNTHGADAVAAAEIKIKVSTVHEV